MLDKFSEFDAGCIFDGCFGQFDNDIRVLELAVDYGFRLSKYHPKNKAYTTEYLEKYVDESDTDPTIDAVDYLNTHAAIDGFHFEWYDGDFVYISDSELE